MSGYIGTTPSPQTTQARHSYTATASQTSFSTSGYTAGFVDVYLNGVKLIDGTDFTATNGSDVVLTTGAALNDLLDILIFTAVDLSTAVGGGRYKGVITGAQIFSQGGNKYRVEILKAVMPKPKIVKKINNVDGDMLYSTLKQHLGI